MTHLGVFVQWYRKGIEARIQTKFWGNEKKPSLLKSLIVLQI